MVKFRWLRELLGDMPSNLNQKKKGYGRMSCKKSEKINLSDPITIDLIGGYMILGTGRIFDKDKDEWKNDSSAVGKVIIGDSMTKDNIKISYTNLLLIFNAINENKEYIKHYYELESLRRKRDQKVIDSIVF